MVVQEVAAAIYAHSVTKQKDTVFPTRSNDLHALEAEFHVLWQLPGACGAVDGCHFRIRKPVVDGDSYVGYKMVSTISCSLPLPKACA
jgi:hypothetical protein